MNDKEYSVRFALEELENAINTIQQEITDLENAIKASSKPVNSLVIEYNQKKQIYEALVSRQQKLMELSNSYGHSGVQREGMAKRDERLKNLDNRIEDLSSKTFTPSSKNAKANRVNKKLNAKIKRLQKKQGRMSNRQKKVTSAKLRKEIRYFKRQGKLTGIEMSRSDLIQMHQNNALEHLNRANELANSDKFFDRTIKNGVETVKAMVEFVKMKSVKPLITILAKKQGIVIGATTTQRYMNTMESGSRGR